MELIASHQKYKLQNLIGEGSSSEVYKALRSDDRTDLKEWVAIKILNSPSLAEAWKKEYQTLRKIRAPQCVRALSWEWINKKPAIIMDYIHGVSLLELCQSYSLSEQQIQNILKEIRTALEGLHEQSVFHGDLSPKNILVDDKEQIWLVDYGLQGQCGNDLFTTEEFCHPDLIKGTIAPHAETDLYSLTKVKEFLMEHRTQQPSLSLKDKVLSLLNHRIDLHSTQKITQPQKKSIKLSTIFGILLFPILSFVSVKPNYAPLVAKDINVVSVRTHKSYKIYVDDQYVGRPPLSFHFQKPQVTVRAEGGGSVHTRVLLKSKNSHRVLNDQFFTKYP